MPIFESADGRGDMFVEYNVVLPTSLTPSVRKSTLFGHAPFSLLLTFVVTELTEAFRGRGGKEEL